MNRFVEPTEEPRSVPFAHGRRAASRNAHLSQFLRQGARRQGFADYIPRKGVSLRTQDSAAVFQATLGEEDVRCDDDVGRAGAFGNPIVDRAEPRRQHNRLAPIGRRRFHAAVANDEDAHGVPFGDAVGFALHGAGVGIDVNARHVQSRDAGSGAHSSFYVQF
jgi:hypothetical protein